MFIYNVQCGSRVQCVLIMFSVVVVQWLCVCACSPYFTCLMNHVSYENIIQKISESNSLSDELKEVLTLLSMMFSNALKERDEKYALLESKMNEQHEEVGRAFGIRDDKIIAAEREIVRLRGEVSKLQRTADEQDSYVRRESLIFSGDLLPAASENEDCTKIVRKLIREDLQLNLDPLISTAHRLGKPPSSNSTPDNRDIIAKFCQRDDKFRIYTTARQKKIPGLWVNESLTPVRRRVYHTIRKMRKSYPKLITGLTTHNGRILVYTKPSPSAPEGSPSVRVEINSLEYLTDFSDNFLKKPISDFISSN